MDNGGDALVAEALRELTGASAEQIVDWAVSRFADRLCAAVSMQDGVLVDLLARRAPGVTVFFLDTGYHFPETLATRDAVATRYPVRVVTLRPTLSVAEQDARYGPRLYARDPDACCRMRKVEPLVAALSDFDAWVTGVRRADSPARAGTRCVERDTRSGLVKVNPLAEFTDDDLASYVADHDPVRNPLLAAGYPSIGCAPCTRGVGPTGDRRSGRWPGWDKTECGLHGGAGAAS